MTFDLRDAMPICLALEVLIRGPSMNGQGRGPSLLNNPGYFAGVEVIPGAA